MKNTRQKLTSLVLIILAMTLAIPSFATGIPPKVNGKAIPSLAPMLKKVMPAVVNVSAQGVIKPSKNPLKDDKTPLLPSPKQQPPNAQPNKFFSLGSGVVINAQKGYILTNAHVIAGANNITVTLSDGRHFKATIIGVDRPSDIAVLQIHAKHLTAIHVANSSKLEVGDFVLAIGNPFGLNQTVTSGIVSALQRTDLHIEGYENFIQTDAPINEGNSGGALINLKGQLVGINTAILTQDGGSIGIGFAIPSNMALAVMHQLIKYGKIERGLIGIMVQTFTPALANAFHMPATKGAVITQITPDSPAQQAGLQPYDVIEKINGQRITSAAQIKNVVGIMRVGSAVKIEYRRGDKLATTTIHIGSHSNIKGRQAKSHPYFLGVNLQNFNGQSSIQGHIEGVIITNVGKDSAASRAQLIPGDVIVGVDHHPIHNIKQLDKLISHLKQPLLLRVIRNNGALFLVLK